MSNDGEPEMTKPEVFLTGTFVCKEKDKAPLCFTLLLERQSVAVFTLK